MSKPYRPEQLRHELFLGSLARRDGVLTPKQLRSGAWVRLGRDVYADARVERDHRLACQAAALVLPPEAAFAGLSAAYLLGVEHAAEFRDPVHVVVPDTAAFRSRTNLRVHHVRLKPGDIDRQLDLTTTSGVRTVWDLASWSPPVQSVPVIDSLLAAGRVTVTELDRYLAGRQGERGSLRAARAVSLADGRSQSPQESRLRVKLVLAGLPAPVPQCPVRVGGITLHPDIGWPEYKVGAEYDGTWHASAAQLHRDRKRLNLLTVAGWLIVHVTADRQRRDFDGVVHELRTVLRSRGWPG